MSDLTLQEQVELLRKAIHFTREYVGEETLPAIPGWSWYDAMVETGGLMEIENTIEEETPTPPEPFANWCDWGNSQKAELVDKTTALRQEIERIINCYSAENESNTPDFILAEFVVDALHAFDKAVRMRTNWYGGDKKTNEDFEDEGGDGWDNQYNQPELVRKEDVVRPREPVADMDRIQVEQDKSCLPC